MADIVTRLRTWANLKYGEMPPEDMRDGETPGNWAFVLRRLHAEAANEIEHLRVMNGVIEASRCVVIEALADDDFNPLDPAVSQYR